MACLCARTRLFDWFQLDSSFKVYHLSKFYYLILLLSVNLFNSRAMDAKRVKGHDSNFQTQSGPILSPFLIKPQSAAAHESVVLVRRYL